MAGVPQTIEIKVDTSDLKAFMEERDALRDRITELTTSPLGHSLEQLAQRLSIWGSEKGHLTPSQCNELSKVIRNNGVYEECP